MPNSKAPCEIILKSQALLDEYSLYISNKSDTTRRTYERIVTAFLTHVEGNGVDVLGESLPERQSMEAFISTYIDSIFKMVKGKPVKLSSASQRTYLSTISSFYTWLIDIKKITQANPAAVLMRSKRFKKSPIGNNLQESEFKTIMENFNVPPQRKGTRYYDIMNQRDHCIIHLLGASGMRRIEMHRLDIRGYDRDKQSILVKGKGNKIRTIPIPDTAATVLCHYIDNVRPLYPTPIPSDAFALFLRPIKDIETGNEYSIRMPLSNITDRVGRILAKAGITKGRGPHTLRRSYGIWLLEDSNYNLRLVQEVLGHADVSTTQRYTSLSNKLVREQTRGCFRERGQK